MKNQWLHVFAGVLLIALSAQVSFEIPLSEAGVPISGQSFMVCLVAFFMTRWWAVATVSLYVLLGILGLPIFADGESGWTILAGGSGGYLVGFIVAAFAMGWMGELGWRRSFGRGLLATLIGTVLLLLFGVLRLAWLYDFEKALTWGLIPFISGAIVKVFFGGVLSWWINSLFTKKK